ncbi:AAA family ATPase, partial [Staphylococcus aureus]
TTLLARAVAARAGAPFITPSGTAFVELFVGDGASHDGDIYDNAENNATCTIFIADSVAGGSHRQSWAVSG